MSQANKLFIFINFDGTTFNTFEPSPSGIGVHEAYDRAVRDIFGDEGHILYSVEGLQNREPGQLFDTLCKKLGIDVESMFGSRKDGIRKFVETKLSYMLGDISPEWPKPYPGVVDFFKAVEEGRLPVEIGGATSGHEPFLDKAYKENGLNPPKIKITSDDINALVEPKRHKYRPYPYQVAVLHFQMLRLLRGDGYFVNMDESGRFLNREDGVKKHTIFIGDHPIIDGGVAERSRIPFGFVPFQHPEFRPDPKKGQFLIPDFFALMQLLEDNRNNIERGMSASEIFFGVPDLELFPPVAESERPYNVWLREMRRIPTIPNEDDRKTARGIAESTGFPTVPIKRGKEIA
ncbi:MAG: hypothetical protein HY426_00640 [Candidatus Levybacteria bacterium]|nr:hypothetical protein [Candidatus Levybacteria bacterium]